MCVDVCGYWCSLCHHSNEGERERVTRVTGEYWRRERRLISSATASGDERQGVCVCVRASVCVCGVCVRELVWVIYLREFCV